MEGLFSWRRVSRCASMFAIVIALACTIACGGDDDNGSGGGDGGGTGGGSQVSNGSRLGWDQPAASTQQVQSMQFRVYVDDSPMSLSGVNCAQSAAAGVYGCSGLLPTMSAGRHVLQLASVLSGVESARSESLTITITASTTEATPPELSDSGSDAGPAQSTVCFAEPRDCYAVRVVARGLRQATALSALPDGRLLFIEDESRVRVIAQDTLLPAPALTVSDPNSRLVSLAIDGSSSDTTSVFVASSDITVGGRARLNVTRYREVAGTLGEGAAIVTGQPFAQGASAPMAVDGRGLLYVALPAAATDRHGVVLRFTRDGFVPEINWRGLPVIAAGYAQPTSIAIDVEHEQLWLAGSDPSWPSRVSALAIVYDPAFAENRPEPIHVQELPALDASLAVLPGTAGSGASLLIAAGGRLVSGSVTSSGTVSALRPVESVPFVMLGPAANGPRGKWYALSGGQKSGVFLLSLTPTTR